MLGSIHCLRCGAICGERSADYRGTEERIKRRRIAECRGGPADGYTFTFEGEPPALYQIPHESGGGLVLPGGDPEFAFTSIGLWDDVYAPRELPQPWAYRPLVTEAGYARNASWHFIYEFAG
jgi:hypothetical protein